MEKEEKAKLLIVEDDESTINIYTYALKKHFAITAVKSANEFRSVLTNERFNLFIIDLSLKGSTENGIDLVHNLRAMNSYQKTPIFVITGHALKLEEQRSIDAGATEFLRKPIDLKKLVLDAATYSVAS